MRLAAHLIALPAALLPAAGRAQTAPGYRHSPRFDEQVRLARPADGVRVLLQAPGKLRRDVPTRLVLYATPNGNTIEQTLGARAAPGLDWHYDIQHVAAQIRRLREVWHDEDVVLACIEAKQLSWPAWRAAHGGAGAGIRAIVAAVRELVPGGADRLTLSAHSGGGSFLWGFLEDGEAIPDDVDRIVFLDADYSYDDNRYGKGRGHGEQLLAWLHGPSHRLVVLAYDDREITYRGKKVVGPTGGTFRATGRMLARFGRDLKLTTEQRGELEITRGLGGRFTAIRHRNPDNRILHTALVGEMNGLLWALTLGTSAAETWGHFGPPRAYADWIQPVPGTGLEAAPAGSPTSQRTAK